MIRSRTSRRNGNDDGDMREYVRKMWRHFRKSGPSGHTDITFSVPSSQVNYSECSKRKSTLFIPNLGVASLPYHPNDLQTQRSDPSSDKETGLSLHYITVHPHTLVHKISFSE